MHINRLTIRNGRSIFLFLTFVNVRQGHECAIDFCIKQVIAPLSLISSLMLQKSETHSWPHFYHKVVTTIPSYALPKNGKSVREVALPLASELEQHCSRAWNSENDVTAVEYGIAHNYVQV